MSEKIKSISETQSAALAQYALDAIELAYSTEPYDRAKGEAAIRASYRIAKLDEPVAVAWVPSPYAAMVLGPVLDMMHFGTGSDQVDDEVFVQICNEMYDPVDGQVDDRVRKQVFNQVDDQVDDQVNDRAHDQVDNQVDDRARDQVDDQTHAHVDVQVFEQIADEVDDQVRDQMRDKVDDRVRAQAEGQVRNQVFNQVDDQVDDQVVGQVRDKVNDRTRAHVDGQVDDQVADKVDDRVRKQVFNQVDDQVDAQVDEQVRNQVFNQVDDQVVGQVRGHVDDRVRAQVRAHVRKTWYHYIGGSTAAAWATWRLAIYDVLGLDASEASAVVRDRMLHCGPTWISRNIAIISDRPVEVHRGHDSAGNRVLHCETGPSMRWSDGWAIYSLEGVRVPRKVVMDPSGITLSEIENEPNQEVQRIMRERYGMERWLTDAGATVVSMDSVPIESWNESAGSIERALLEVPSGAKYVVASDGSTGRVYVMRAPDNAETPEDFYRLATGFTSSKCLAQG